MTNKIAVSELLTRGLLRGNFIALQIRYRPQLAGSKIALNLRLELALKNRN